MAVSDLFSVAIKVPSLVHLQMVARILGWHFGRLHHAMSVGTGTSGWEKMDGDGMREASRKT